ncbi:MAG: hypothetical protein AAF757_13280 [Cyanobacteria bacterium P01_D01_bin.116]
MNNQFGLSNIVREILPEEHFVDTGYIDAQLLVNSKNEYNVDLIGPPPGDSQWQSRADKGFGLADFEIDWSQQVVRCPLGKLSSYAEKSLKSLFSTGCCSPVQKI